MRACRESGNQMRPLAARPRFLDRSTRMETTRQRQAAPGGAPSNATSRAAMGQMCRDKPESRSSQTRYRLRPGSAVATFGGAIRERLRVPDCGIRRRTAGSGGCRGNDRRRDCGSSPPGGTERGAAQAGISGTFPPDQATVETGGNSMPDRLREKPAATRAHIRCHIRQQATGSGRPRQATTIKLNPLPSGGFGRSWRP